MKMKFKFFYNDTLNTQDFRQEKFKRDAIFMLKIFPKPFNGS